MKESKIKALVVDDEKIIRDFFSRLLSLQGLDVSEAADGNRAIELSREEVFDLYFIDVRMPGLDGLETYRRIRQINQDAVCVMMTGYAMDDILEQAKKEGVFSSIRKPFAIDEIRGIVNKVSEGTKNSFLNILVVDDDEAVLSFFSNFLSSRGIKYKIACNKEEALVAVRQEKFDLAFLDLVLKDADGLQVYKEIKKELPEVTIVVITGNVQKAKELGDMQEMASCLYKPFEIEHILECIDKAKAFKK